MDVVGGGCDWTRDPVLRGIVPVALSVGDPQIDVSDPLTSMYDHTPYASELVWKATLGIPLP